MIIKTCGDEHLPKILGLHPMMASGEPEIKKDAMPMLL